MDKKKLLLIVGGVVAVAVLGVVAAFLLSGFTEKHAVTFKSGDEVIATYEIRHGSEIEEPSVPALPEDEEHFTYSFTGWDQPVPEKCMQDMTFNAVFEKDTVIWTVDDAGVLTIAPKNGSMGTFESIEATEDIPWLDERERITSVVVSPGVRLNASAVGLFSGLSACSEIDAANLDTSICTNFSGMFKMDAAMTELDLSGWNTTAATDMTGFFERCDALNEVTLGDKFSFTGAGETALCTLPTPAGLAGDGGEFTGMWQNRDKEAYSAADVPGMKAEVYKAQTTIDVEKAAENEASRESNANASTTTTASTSSAQSTVVRPSASASSSTANADNGSNARPNANASASANKNSNSSAGNAQAAVHNKGVYAVLYEDGSLVISGSANSDGRAVKASYSNIGTGVPWSGAAADIKSVSVAGNVSPTWCAKWFKGCVNLTEVDLSGLNTKGCEAMGNMFSGCTSLEKVTLGKDFSFTGSAGYRMSALPLPQGCSHWVDGGGDAFSSVTVPNWTSGTYVAI